MGTDRSKGDIRAFLVPDTRITMDNVTAKDHATALLRSDYTEAGPFTGPPIESTAANLVLRTSGSQVADTEIEIRTTRAGGVGLEDAGFVWERVDKAGQPTFGWDAPAIATDWDALVFVAGDDLRQHINPKVIRLQSGKLLAVYGVRPKADQMYARVFDPATDSWGAELQIPTGIDLSWGLTTIGMAVDVCQLSSGRVLFFLATSRQVMMTFVDDDFWIGASLGGLAILQTDLTTVVEDMKVAFSPETQELLLLVMYGAGVNKTIDQYASADLGTTFTLVQADLATATSAVWETADIAPMLGGGFCVVYTKPVAATPANGRLDRILLGSAFDNLADGETAEVNAAIHILGADNDCTVFRDEDDTMWVYVSGSNFGGNDGLGVAYRSINQGDTWVLGSACTETHELDSTAASGAVRLRNYDAASVAGRVALIHKWDSSATFDTSSVGVLWYGGYNSLTLPTADTSGGDFQDTDYIAWGDQGLRRGSLYIPIEFPTTIGWVLGGTGAQALDSAAEALRLTSTAAAGDSISFSRNHIFASTVAGIVEVELEIDAGDGNTAAFEIGFSIVLSDSTNYYDLEVHCSSAGFRVYDNNLPGYIHAAVTFDLTTKGRIRLQIGYPGNAFPDTGVVEISYGRRGHYRDYTVESALDARRLGAAPAANRIVWGNVANVANISRWTHVAYNLGIGKRSPTDTARWGIGVTRFNGEIDLHPRSYFTNPALIAYGVQISAIAGPTVFGDSHTIETNYEHPLQAMIPDYAASPGRAWEAIEDGATYEIVFDLERKAAGAASFFESSSFGCFLVNTNIHDANFQYWTGAAWVDMIALDAAYGATTFKFTRKGSIVYADTGAGAPTGDRWSPHMMHAGDKIFLDGGGEASVYRTIESNSEGGYRTGSKLARLKLEDVDVGDPTSGDATIYRRNHGGVVHGMSVFPRYLRLVIAAQKTVEGHYKIGSLVAGPVFPFGLQYGNGWSGEREQNVELNTRDSGVRSARKRGKSRRAVELSWTSQPQDTTRMWDTEPSPDFITGITGDDPIASLADTVYQVQGLVERTEGSSIPIVYIGKLGRSSAFTDERIITHDEEWLYGRIVTDDPSYDQVVGAEGESPVLRGNRIRIEEEV